MLPKRSDRGAISARPGFTMIELLMVITIIMFLAGMVFGLSTLASSKMKIARIQGDLARLTTAIDFYKAKYKVYPPDNQFKNNAGLQYVLSSATNQLVLELDGCIITNKAFSSSHIRTPSGGQMLLDSAGMKRIFGDQAAGVLNASTNSSRVKSFIGNYSSSRLGKITNGNVTFDIFKVPAEAPLYNASLGTAKAWRRMGFNNPWQYNVSSPTNNPGGYDLWAEFQLGRQADIQKDETGRRYIEYYVIGNWNDMKPEIRRDYF